MILKNLIIEFPYRFSECHTKRFTFRRCLGSEQKSQTEPNPTDLN